MEIKQIWILLTAFSGLLIILFVPYTVVFTVNDFDQISIDEKVYFNGLFKSTSSLEGSFNWEGYDSYILVPIFTLIGILTVLIAGYLNLLNDYHFSKINSILLICGGIFGLIGTILFIPFGMWIDSSGIIDLGNSSSTSIIDENFHFYIGFYFAIIFFLLIFISGITNLSGYLPSPEEGDSSAQRLSEVAQARQRNR